MGSPFFSGGGMDRQSGVMLTAFTLGMLLWAWGLYALGATSIFVCGTSTYTCASGSDVGTQALNDPVGGVTISDDVTSKSIQVPIGTNSKGQCPAGWTNCGAGQVPAPPATVASTGTTYSGGSQSPNINGSRATCNGSVSVAALSSCICSAWLGASSSSQSCVVDSVNGLAVQYTGCQGTPASCASPPTNYFTLNDTSIATANCAVGYTWNGTTCALSNAALAQKPVDGKCGIVRTGNSYAYDPQDPDCFGSGSAGVQFNLTTASGTVTVGNSAATLRVTANSSDGSATVKSDTPVSGNTVTKQIAVGPVVGGEYGLTLGTATTTTTGVSSGSLVPSTDPPKDPCGLPSTPPCKFDETGTPTDSGSMATALADYNTAKAARESSLTALGTSSKVTNLGLTFGVTWPSVACSDPTFVIPGSGGKSLTVPLCIHQGDVNLIMGWLMFVLTGFYLFNLIRGIA